METGDPKEQLQQALEKARSGDYAEARRQLEELRPGLESFSDLHFYLGMTCLRLGDTQAATNALLDCLELDPFHDEARRQLRELVAANPSLSSQTASPPPPPAGDGLVQQFLVKPAGFWIRAMAAFLDGLLCSFAAGPLGFLASLPVFSFFPEMPDTNPEELADRIVQGDTDLILGLVVITLIEVSIALTLNTIYYTYFHFVSGQTLGKRVLGIRVVDHATLDYLGGWQSFGRYAASSLSGLICGIGFLMAAMNPEKRTLHDFMAKTRVVYSEPVPITQGEKTLVLLLLTLSAGNLVIDLFL